MLCSLSQCEFLLLFFFRSMHFINIFVCVWCPSNFLWLKLQVCGAKFKAAKTLIKKEYTRISMEALIQ